MRFFFENWHTNCGGLPQEVSDEIFFLKIGIERGTYFLKKVPNFEIVWPTPATPRALTIKSVYEVSYSWYGQIIGSVCI